jgi:hypothetical protein
MPWNLELGEDDQKDKQIVYRQSLLGNKAR